MQVHLETKTFSLTIYYILLCTWIRDDDNLFEHLLNCGSRKLENDQN